MFKMLARLFAPVPVAPELDEEIPRYPPFAKGLPAVPSSKLLETHQDLLKQIRRALMFDQTEFDTLVMPVIERYAAFVHLLPASQNHHHHGGGGLLYHGLEVGYLAALASEDVLFSAQEEPSRRLALEPRWRLAVFLAGLLHDIGKPVSDLSVTDVTGEHRWIVYSSNIADWAQAHKIDRYFLHWNQGRHGAHEMMSASVMDRVLTDECNSYLVEISQGVREAMSFAVMNMGTDDGHIGRLIRHADSVSVERDLQRNGKLTDGSLHVPVEQYLLDAMRRLVKKGAWKVNEKGARLWMLDGALYVVWHTAAHEITELLVSDKVPGVPRDPDSMADVLIDRAMAVPRKTDSTTYRYWPMRPETFSESDPNRLMMLRLKEPEQILDYAPASISAEIIETRASRKKASSTDSTADRDADSATETATPVKEPKTKAKARPPKNRQSSPTLGPAIDAASPHEQADDDLADEQPAQNTDDDLAEYDNWAGQQQAHIEEIGEAPAAEPVPALANPPVSSVEPPVIDFEAGHADSLLRRIHEEGQWDTHLFMHNDHVVIAYPEGAALAAAPADVQRVLGDEGVIVPDPTSRLMLVRILNGRKGIMLDKRRSNLFLGPVDETASPALEPDKGNAVPASSEVAPKPADKTDAQPAKAKKNRGKRRKKRGRPDDSAPSANTASETHAAPAGDRAKEINACVQALIDGARDPDNIFGARCVREGEWFYMPQFLIGMAVSNTSNGSSISSNEARQALAAHPDVNLVGTEKIAIRAKADG